MATTNKRPAFAKGFSPAGIAVFPALNKPDTKFNADGVYKVKLRVTDEEAQPLIDKVAALAEQHLKDTKADLTAQLAEATDGKKKKALKDALAGIKMADSSITDDVDDEGDPNGFKLLGFKSPSSYKSKKDLDDEGNPKPVPIRITICAANGKPIASPPAIWGGSKLVIAYELRPFYTASVGVGVSLRLTGAQILELKTGGQGGGNPGFASQEGYGDDEDEAPTSDAAGQDRTEGPGASEDDF